MADKEKRRYQHVGNVSKEKTESDPRCKLSPANAHSVVVAAWDNGHIHITAHFKARGQERSFDVIDAENVIRDGKMYGEGEYCHDHKNWKYRFRGKVEEKTLEIVVSLDPTNGYANPLVIVLTGYWRTSSKV
ncbi:MAG TPA: DUF4258 domain-containing protein [Candidatus Angelobacter sp.]|nr:DUF4258 domain-containing protein [Candidatus Angelobacter sp.]